MVTRRTAKQKGSSFEYDCQSSLKPLMPDIYRTSERGFQLQYDLRTDQLEMVFECKRLKSMSWNQAKKYFKKLEKNSPKDYTPYLLLKSNQQPCLVMYEDTKNSTINNREIISINEFESVFGTPFIKHKSTRKKKEEREEKNNGIVQKKQTNKRRQRSKQSTR